MYEEIPITCRFALLEICSVCVCCFIKWASVTSMRLTISHRDKTDAAHCRSFAVLSVATTHPPLSIGLAYPISTEERTASTAACASAPLHENSRATKGHAPRLPATTKLLAIPGSAAFTTAHSPLASTYGTRLATLCSVYVWYKRTMYIVTCSDHHHQPVHRPLP